MTPPVHAAKKKVMRKHILQQAGDLFLHPVSDRNMAANLKSRYPSVTPEDVRELFPYLEQKGLAVIRKNGSGRSLQITAAGIDVLEGAAKVRGVEAACPRFTGLEYKKEIRRGVLAYCYAFQEFFNEDTEILEEFRRSGFANLLLEEVRFHIWYLARKDLLDMKAFAMGGGRLFMARITPRGVDLVEKNATEPGVQDDGE